MTMSCIRFYDWASVEGLQAEASSKPSHSCVSVLDTNNNNLHKLSIGYPAWMSILIWPTWMIREAILYVVFHRKPFHIADSSTVCCWWCRQRNQFATESFGYVQMWSRANTRYRCSVHPSTDVYSENTTPIRWVLHLHVVSKHVEHMWPCTWNSSVVTSDVSYFVSHSKAE